MKLKNITITRGYKKSGNFNTISGEITLNYDLEASEVVSKAFEMAKSEVDSLITKHYEKQDKWMNKLIDKPTKVDTEGYQ